MEECAMEGRKEGREVGKYKINVNNKTKQQD